MFIMTFLTFAVEIDHFREPLGVVVRRNLNDRMNKTNEKRKDEGTNEKVKSGFLMC